MDRRFDLLIALGFGVVGVVVIASMWDVRVPAYLSDPVGPKGLAFVMGGFMVGGTAILAIRRVAVWGRQQNHEVAMAEGRPDDPGHPGSFLRAASVWASLLLYAYLLPRLGFLIATALAVAGILWLTKVRGLRQLLALALGIPIATWLMFDFFLGLNLPRGILRSIPFL